MWRRSGGCRSCAARADGEHNIHYAKSWMARAAAFVASAWLSAFLVRVLFCRIMLLVDFKGPLRAPLTCSGTRINKSEALVARLKTVVARPAKLYG